jgi:hypothetical protein
MDADSDASGDFNDGGAGEVGAALENSLRFFFLKNIFFQVQCCRYGVLYEYSS